MRLPAEEEQTPQCPPHRWFIEAEYKPEGSTETWTCSYCGETKTVQRERDAAKPPWTVGRDRPAAQAQPAAPASADADDEEKEKGD